MGILMLTHPSFFLKIVYLFRLLWALAVAHRLEDVVAGKIFNGAMWDLVPRLGIEPGPLHWECRVLAAGPAGKFHQHHFHFQVLGDIPRTTHRQL